MTPDALRRHIRSLNVWKRGDRRAPHKPLLVLYALGRLEQGERWVAFRTVDDDLRHLLVEFGPSRQRHHPEYPFWRLQNDGIWTVKTDKNLTRRASNTDPLKSELVEYNVEAGFTDAVWATLRQDETLRRDIARRLLEEHFPPSLHADICEAVGLRLDPQTATNRTRDPDFRPTVLQAYSYQCAICGFDLKIDRTPIGLEAAHIQWHNHGGPDDVTNGIALCALHHKMLDKGAIHVTTHARLLVSEAVHGSDPHLKRLRNRHGRRIHAPQRAAYEPSDAVVEWHVEEVFRGPPRT
jgi:putative restriction endonuclease